jgi:tetratricopeptide (TPR) repeat protein
MSSKRQVPKKSKAVPPSTTGALKAVPKPMLSRRRKWLFRLAAVIIAPLLCFAMLEAGLQLCGYGYPTRFFIGPDNDGVYTANEQFGWRFFPPALARQPVPSFISAKASGTIRIFILGSSAAQGIPNPSFSFGRILEAMLPERYPGVKFEVINAAMTAINSHVAREIARDCAAHEPDLFIAYMGNNEIVGPYGPGTIFHQWSPSLKFIRANIWLKSTRTGQLLGNLMQFFQSRDNARSTWGGMEMFLGNQVTADDPRLPAVYDNFQRNLTDICNIARRAGAGIILSTVAVNLRDCPPFASQHQPDLSAEELTKWKTLYQAGVELEAKKQWPEALKQYEAAARIDDRFAELSYRMGRCFAAENRSEEARSHFCLARDLDALRFRADSKINAAIREVAATQKTNGVLLADAEQSLMQNNSFADGIPDGELFHEHVHFTFKGNYLLARVVLDQIDAALPQLASSKHSPILTEQQCMELLPLTRWDEYQTASQIMEMTSKPPFTNQLDHSDFQTVKSEQSENLRQLASTPEALREACKKYEAALEKSPDDWDLLYRFGRLTTASGQPEAAAVHLRNALKKLPRAPMVHNDLGIALQNIGRMNEAIAEYQKTLEIDPGFAMAHYNLGCVLSSLGRQNEAIAEYRKALEIDPGYAMSHNNMGNAFSQCGQKDEAIAEFRKALELDPKLVIAHINLGNTLHQCGRKDEGIAQIQRALEIEPKHAVANYNLGIILEKGGRTIEAIPYYQKAVDIDPQFALGHSSLGHALDKIGQYEKAIAHFRKAVVINPRNANAYCDLGKALALRGRTDEAIEFFQKALTIKPDFKEASQYLHAIRTERSGGSSP